MDETNGRSCLGIGCDKKLRCYRYVASQDFFNGFFIVMPNINGTCYEYVEVPKTYPVHTDIEEDN